MFEHWHYHKQVVSPVHFVLHWWIQCTLPSAFSAVGVGRGVEPKGSSDLSELAAQTSRVVRRIPILIRAYSDQFISKWYARM